jgi:hypothetical protein
VHGRADYGDVQLARLQEFDQRWCHIFDQPKLNVQVALRETADLRRDENEALISLCLFG